jgi:hypothetical protein
VNRKSVGFHVSNQYSYPPRLKARPLSTRSLALCVPEPCPAAAEHHKADQNQARWVLVCHFRDITRLQYKNGVDLRASTEAWVG